MNAQVTLPELERELVRVCRALHARGWVANHEGNATVLTPDGRILATPTAMSKADVREADLIVVDRQGRKVSGGRKAFSELPMHLVSYQSRTDVGAVVHAHPPAATAFAAAGQAIEATFLPEFVVSIGGRVPLVPFALPGSESLNNALLPFMEPFDVVLLQNHGVLAWGPDLSTALNRIEHCEEAASVLLNVRALGGPKPLPDEVVRLLLDSRTQAGLGPAGRAKTRSRG